MRACTRCKSDVPEEKMGRQASGRDGYHSWCKDCINERAREKRKRHDTPEKRRKWLLSQRYGMTIEQWDSLYQQQKGVCAICSGEMARPVTDHNHKTGEVRGILCHPCNVKLHAVEDEFFRERALAYLRDSMA